MRHSRPDSIAIRLCVTLSDRLRDPVRPGFRAAILLGLCMTILSIALPGQSLAQDWGSESEDDWSQPASSTSAQGGPGARDLPLGWSARIGIGFIDDPNAFLLNLEAPYVFDQWVSAGPMFQIGLDNNNTIVAPTMNVTVTIPHLPGEKLDRIHPFGFVGMGFAYIEDDNRRNDNSSAGFLINFGFGVEYQISDNVLLGSQMMFNFLPEEVLDERFFYAWQIGGVRISF